jgi:hypothetical protein
LRSCAHGIVARPFAFARVAPQPVDTTGFATVTGGAVVVAGGCAREPRELHAASAMTATVIAATRHFVSTAGP